MDWIIVGVYGFSLLTIFIFSLGQLHLTWIYTRSKKVQTPDLDPDFLPNVTVQLPVYNEKYVIDRLIDSICQLDYPKDKLEIQILDDSTDETVALIQKKVAEYQKLHFDIHQIRRDTREGFKAGALAYGLQKAKGTFIAVFDADFLPKSEFLRATIPYFINSEIGLVQTRWGHVNKDYSILTQLQAFGLDGHFTVEQTGRNMAGSFINFNGTAGVWRKSCIEDAGGWSADTLTEDLDLSYRAQLKGWKFKYLENVVSPAELPVVMPAIKSQQYRWNKGAAETARKHLGKVLTSDLPLLTKIHAFFHLFNSSIFLALLIASIASVPMLYIKDHHPRFELIFDLGSIFILGFMSIGIFYYIASKSMNKHPIKYFSKYFPLFLAYSMGLSLHNSIAVVEGLLGYKTPFIRTPKFNIFNKNDNWTANTYIHPKLTISVLIEGLLCSYYIFGMISGFLLKDYGLMFFHLLLTLGFGSIFFHSIRPMSIFK